MNKKNYNNDHESFMEGIYGCMERIETDIIELQKVQPNRGNSAANNEDRTALVHEVKEHVSNATGLNCWHTDRKLEEQTKVLNSNFSAISGCVRDVKAIVNKSHSSGEVLNSLSDIKSSQEQKQVKEQSLFNFMQGVIAQLQQMGKQRTSETYRCTLKSFMQFRGNKDVLLEDIDSDLMLMYEAYLRVRGLTKNSTSFYMRILRAVYNRAVEKDLTTNRNPFKHVYTGVDKTIKRAIPLKAIKQIKNLDLSLQTSLDLARDMFLFSFYTRGMSFIDMAYLKKKDLANGILSYRRRKTGQQLFIRWEKCMQEIVEKYENTLSNYLLPIIKPMNSDERTQYQNSMYLINRKLKEIGKMAGIQLPLTMYVARHSWASVAKNKNVPISVISEGMGHDSEITTQIYLASLDTSVVDKANSMIINSL